MGSVAMNAEGYIALGYSVSSNNTYPSIRYTGRGPNAPLGEMVFTEETIIDGSGVQTGEASRWGDYSKMSIDPVDNETFWFTTEYVEQTGSANWQTRIASFQLEEDFIAPEAVADLSAEVPTTNGVWLHWTSTPDNLGTPYLYDIRYSAEPITEDNFEEATQATDTPDPSAAGTPESFYISDLDFNENYYFALKVADRQYNFSDLSNIAQATTPGLPHLEVDQAARQPEAYQGYAVADEIELSNTGDSDIRFSLTKGDTVANTPGDIITTFPEAGTGLLGMHFADEKIYLVNSGIRSLMIYDTTAHALVDTVQIHKKPFGITSDGEKLWIGSINGLIKAYDFEGNPTGDSLTFPMQSYHALAFNGTHLLLNPVNEDDPVIFKLNPETGEQEGVLLTDIDMDIWQSTWVQQHQEGKLWITNNDGVIAQLVLDEETETYHVLQQFEAPATISFALSHSGEHLLYAETANTIYLVDDGVDEVNWLSYHTLSDTIASGDNFGLTLTYDAATLNPGMHSAFVTIHSNDPEHPEKVIPVEFTVLPYDEMELNIAGLPAQVCRNNPVFLTAEVAGGAGNFSYMWYNADGDPVGEESTLTVVTAEETSYYVYVEDAVSSATDSVTLNPEPSPEFTLGADTTLCINHELELGIPEGFASYEWQDGSTSNTFMVDSTSAALGENFIIATVEGDNGCSTTDTLKVTMETCAGIADNPLSQSRIYPNPVKEELYIELNSSGNVHISITDVNGKEVYKSNTASGHQRTKYTVNVAPWREGVYFIIMRNNEYETVKKFIKGN